MAMQVLELQGYGYLPLDLWVPKVLSDFESQNQFLFVGGKKPWNYPRSISVSRQLLSRAHWQNYIFPWLR